MDNKDIHSTEDISALIQTLIEKAEKDMCEMCGMKLYKKEEGFILRLSKEDSGKVVARSMVRRAYHKWPMSNRSRHKCLQAAIRAFR